MYLLFVIRNNHYSNRLNNKETFTPPKPKELLKAYST